jgi:peptidyl-prolyl cis-trans isomerase SurA
MAMAAGIKAPMSRRLARSLRAFGLAAALARMAFAPAAMGQAQPSQSTGVAAVVNEYVISNYDLDQRTALFVATSGVRPTAETLPQIRIQVLRALEDEVIELQEASKRKINATKLEVDKALQNIAQDNKLTVDQILATIGQSGVTANTFRQQISAQIIWQKLVAARYGAEITITDQQIDEAMDRLKQGSDKPQYLLSEIYMGVDKPEDEISIRASAEQLAQQTRQGASFQTVASQFSQSPSAADGGDIGWVEQGQLADELDHALMDLKPGQIVGPIRAEGGYYVLLLRDRREPVGSKPVQAAATPDPNAPVPLMRFLIPLPANADATVKNRAMALAVNIKAEARACGDLPGISSQLQGTVLTSLGPTDPKDLEPELRDALAKTGPGDTVPPFFSPAGLELIMRCDRPVSASGTFALPTRDQLRQQLSAQQLSLFAKSYLRDLRREAVMYTTGR